MTVTIGRRGLLAALGGAAVAWPGIAISQPSDPLRRIGVLMAISEGDAQVHPRLIAFQKSLHDLGWTDGRNTRIDYRFVVSDPDRIRAAAAGTISDVTTARAWTGAEFKAIGDKASKAASAYRVPGKRK